MTVSAAVEHPRILAYLIEQPGLTAYEVATALGHGKPDSRRVAEIVKRLHDKGVLVARSEFRPRMGRDAQVYYLAPPGTPPPPHRETPAGEQQHRERVSRPGRTDVVLPALPPAWHLPGEPACAGTDPDLFFGPDSEPPGTRVRREAEAVACCHGCPVRRDCLKGATERGEEYGIWGGVNLEATPKAARVGAVTPAPGLIQSVATQERINDDASKRACG